MSLRRLSPRVWWPAAAFFMHAWLGAAAPPAEVKGPKGGFLHQLPIDQVKVDCGKRNPLFYVGEPIAFQLTGPANLKGLPAERFEVRSYWGDVVDQGPAAASITLKSQPAGWYKLYLFAKPLPPPKPPRTAEEKFLDGDKTTEKEDEAARAAWQYRQWYGDAVGGTMFVVVRDDPHFPKLQPSFDAAPKPGSTGDAVMRGISGMGPRRHAADASKPAESIKQLEPEIAADYSFLQPGDPARPRALLIAFPNGTKGRLDGVKQIVERFKNEVKYYEPRNEPNGGSNGADFLKNEMIDFYQTVKSVDPSLHVAGPGTVTINPFPSGLGFIEEFLAAGGGKYLDAFSFHSYNGTNGDLWLARTSMDALTALLKKYDADKTELWQTEQGYFAAVYGAYQPRLQGRWTMLQMLVFDQYGLPKEHNDLWYDVSHGFWDFPTWWENDDRGFNPAWPLMRVFSEELYGTKFSKSYDLGKDGNKLYLGNLYEGDKKRVAAFMSAGSPDGKVELLVKGGAAQLHVVSAFGVERDLPVAGGRLTLPVPELPVYVEMGEGQGIEVVSQDFGANFARAEGVTVAASGTGMRPGKTPVADDIKKLINGELENWYYAQKTSPQPWMDDTKEFPAWIEVRLPAPAAVGRVIIYAPVPWQSQGTLVDYELQYERGGEWVTIEHVKEPLKTFKVLTPPTRTKVDSFFSDRCIFQHEFAPVTTGRIRLLVHDATFGGGATEDVPWAGGQTGPHQVTLREIELYAK
ncbi:MAG TPA: hypothetical protein VGO11_03080 [Chthoniobacteraceae bacterium]|nr:hypothetical protein [Chthoniobacteraceae bacterium]